MKKKNNTIIKIEEAIRQSDLKHKKAWAIELGQDYTNFFSKVHRNMQRVAKINTWLKIIALKFDLVNINEKNKSLAKEQLELVLKYSRSAGVNQYDLNEFISKLIRELD